MQTAVYKYLHHRCIFKDTAFPNSADHEQVWQPYAVDPYSAIRVVTMYHHDISSTVIMLRQFDQWVPAHEIKVPWEDLDTLWIPPLVKIFILFVKRNISKNIQLLGKIPY